MPPTSIGIPNFFLISGMVPKFIVFLQLFIYADAVSAAHERRGCTPILSSGFDKSMPTRAISLLSLSAAVLLGPKQAQAATMMQSTVANVEMTSVAISKAVVATTDEESVINGLISGASTRVAKELVLHPIDTVRTRLQKPPNSEGIVDNQEGLFDNLYDGLLPALVGGVPAGALFFGVKDFTKKKLRNMGLGKQESTILSVMVTNIPYWVIRTPSEVLKTRRQIGYDNSSSVSEMMTKMIEQEGGVLPAIKSSYASYASNFAYALPADIAKFVACKYLIPMIILICNIRLDKIRVDLDQYFLMITLASSHLLSCLVLSCLDFFPFLLLLFLRKCFVFANQMRH
jgi:hypothetical protein